MTEGTIMESNASDTQTQNRSPVTDGAAIAAASASALRKSAMQLSLIAIGLDIIPIVFILLDSYITRLPSISNLLIIFAPISGLLIGVMCLNRLKGQKCVAERVLAIVAMAIPLAMVALILVFIGGVMTGVISLM